MLLSVLIYGYMNSTFIASAKQNVRFRSGMFGFEYIL